MVSNSEHQNYEYQVGSSLPPDAPTYVTRKADRDLYSGLKAGKFCYVLNSRQMGKSSLRVRIMRQLQQEGIVCAAIDLNSIGTQGITPNQWYAGLILELISQLGLRDRFTLSVFEAWWDERHFLSAVQQFGEFLETVLLSEISNRIVIFIDEIDSVLRLEFKDDFFGVIRACHNKRATNPEYNRLTFALMGVASPSDLIQNSQRTPFNIGNAIRLTGFQFHEAQPLAHGLIGRVSNPEDVLEQVLEWTGGQPFLTQKLCGLIAQYRERDWESSVGTPGSNLVDRLVRHSIVENWEAQDEPEHLKTIRDRLLQNEQQAGRLLGLYQQVLQQGEVSADDSFDQLLLQLSGLVVEQQGKLRVYNPIYRLIFRDGWVNRALANLRPYSEALTAWMESGCTDKSRLLRGKALEDALVWSTGKSLSAKDGQFLSDSQSHENWEVKQANQVLQETQLKTQKALVEQQETNQVLQETQQKAKQALVEEQAANQLLREARQGAEQALQVKEQANQSLQEARQGAEQALTEEQAANQRLNKTQRKTRRVLWVGAIGLIGMVILAIVVVTTSQAKLQDVRTAIDWERRGVEAQKQFENDQLGALLSAMQVGREMQTKVHADHSLEDYPAFSPLLTLQTSLSKIQERNRLAHSPRFSVDSKAPDFDFDPLLLKEVGFSPDGKQIFAYTNNKALLWNQSGELLGEYRSSAVNSVVFSPDGMKVVTRYGNKVKLWDLPRISVNKEQLDLSTKPISTFELNSDDSAIKNNPDSNSTLFSYNSIRERSSDGVMRLWNLSGQQIIETRANDISFSRDGKRIITGGDDGIVRLWNTSGQQLTEFRINQSISRISFSSYDTLIAIHTLDLIQVWSLTGQKLTDFSVSSLDSPYDSSDVSFSPDGEQISTFYRDGTVQIWSLQRWSNSFGHPLTEFKAPPLAITTHGVFSPDGKQIVMPVHDSSGNISVRLWNLSKPEQQLTEVKIGDAPPERGQRWQVRFSPDGKRIVIQESLSELLGGDVRSSIVQIWSLTGQKLDEFQGRITEDQKIIAMKPSGTLQLLNLSGQQIAEFNTHQDKSDHPELYSTYFSPNGKQVATVRRNGVTLWNLSGKRLADLNGKDAYSPVSIRFSFDGNQIATIGRSSVHLWDQAGKHLVKLEQKDVKDVQFSPDSKRIVTVSFDGSANLWDLTGQKYYIEQEKNQESVELLLISSPKLRENQEFVEQIELSPDGKRIATIADNNEIRLWNWSGRSGQLTAKFRDSSEIEQIVFSPDGKRIATSGGKTVRLWSLSGQQMAEFEEDGHSDDISFSSDGKRIAIIQLNKVQIFLVEDLDQLLIRGCNWLTAYFADHPDAPRICPQQDQYSRNSADSFGFILFLYGAIYAVISFIGSVIADRRFKTANVYVRWTLIYQLCLAIQLASAGSTIWTSVSFSGNSSAFVTSDGFPVLYGVINGVICFTGFMLAGRKFRTVGIYIWWFTIVALQWLVLGITIGLKLPMLTTMNLLIGFSALAVVTLLLIQSKRRQ